MLDFAFRHAEAVTYFYQQTAYDLDYQYAYAGETRSFEWAFSKDDAQDHELVSLAPDGKICGVFRAVVDRSVNAVTSLWIISAGEPACANTFAQDLLTFLHALMLRYRKISWIAYSGNPAMPFYHRLITRYHGRFVGIKMADVRLLDGEWHDTHQFEILTEKERPRLLKKYGTTLLNFGVPSGRS